MATPLPLARRCNTILTSNIISIQVKPIAHFRSSFPTKFGIPRQSGIVPELRGRIVFKSEYRNMDALRGLDGFDYLWIIWAFSANKTQAERGVTSWQPTVRPPLLGGNTQMGVFATRSPNRPNPIGLSSVKIESIFRDGENGTVITVSGADLLDGTPIYDIKPYIKYADARPEAVCGYVDDLEERSLKVVFPSELSAKISDSEIIPALVETLRLDPRPSYHDDPHRAYGLSFAGYNVRFHVFGNVLEVSDVSPIE